MFFQRGRPQQLQYGIDLTQPGNWLTTPGGLAPSSYGSSTTYPGSSSLTQATGPMGGGGGLPPTDGFSQLSALLSRFGGGNRMGPGLNRSQDRSGRFQPLMLGRSRMAPPTGGSTVAWGGSNPSSGAGGMMGSGGRPSVGYGGGYGGGGFARSASTHPLGAATVVYNPQRDNASGGNYRLFNTGTGSNAVPVYDPEKDAARAREEMRRMGKL